MSTELPLQWVSVKDRLPEQSGEYLTLLISEKDETIDILQISWYANSLWSKEFNGLASQVIAWVDRPLIDDTTIAELVAKWKG